MDTTIWYLNDTGGEQIDSAFGDFPMSPGDRFYTEETGKLYRVSHSEIRHEGGLFKRLIFVYRV